jgi:transposase
MSPHRGREFWERVVAELEQSGLTHEEFARERRLNVGSLRRWLYRLRRERGSTAMRVLPVRVETLLGVHGRTSDVVEIDVAGTVLRVAVGTDVEYVTELLARLRDRC